MAMPGLLDPNFSQTVTCICEHTQDGAVGVVINRVHSALTAKDIFEELDIEYLPEVGSTPIYLGGPVHVDQAFVLHGPPFGWDGCLMVTPFLAMSNTLDIIKAIAMGKGPQLLILAIGCAGWGPYQLEMEIKGNAWLTHPVYEEIIFKTSVETRWEQAMRKLGIDPSLLSDTAGHA